MRKRSLVLLLTLALAAGCAHRGAAPSPPSAPSASASASASTQQATQPPATSQKPNEPLRQQVARASEKLHGKRFSALLHFEKESDELFVSAEPSAPQVKTGEAHTGRAALFLPPGTQRLTVKLSSLLAGRELGGDWTLVGLYVRSDEAVGLALSCEEGGRAIAARKVAIPAGEWTAAMLDISALPTEPKGELEIELRFDQPTGGDVLVDDVLLIDNRETLVDAGSDGWTIKRAGFRITCERKQRFTFGVVTRDGSPAGWDVQEANALRARFTSTGTEAKDLTVYADGRSLWDGAYKPLSVEVREDRTFAAAQAGPADVTVPETMGRVDRNTPGDANNDGYNERLGAYQLQAAGGRLELTITPRGTPVPRPIFQIAGMPPGKALITIEGRLVERSTRLPDDQLLVELPARVTRATLVTVRIQ